jgi:hypothetical protein
MTDISNDAYIARVAICEAAESIRSSMTAPHVLYRPTLLPDGDKWCALLGDDLMVGVSGFGDTPAEAMAAFDNAWRAGKTPAAMVKANGAVVAESYSDRAYRNHPEEFN